MQLGQAIFIGGIAALFSAGCSRSVESPPVRKVPPSLTPQTMELAAEKGKQIVADAFQLLSSNLQNAIQQGGISNALPYCSVAAQPLTRSVGEPKGVTVRRFTHKPRNPQGKANEMEMAVLAHWQRLLPTTNAPAALATNISPGKVTFFAPIVLSQPLCLNCHGQPGKDISPEHVALIDKLYPQDQAKGFEMGDLRGGWRVDFPIETIDESR